MSARRKEQRKAIEALDVLTAIAHLNLHGDVEKTHYNCIQTIRAAVLRPAVQQWQPIETAPVGSNERKESHFIGINKWGSVSRCYRIHNGSGPYAMHSPWYNNHGQEFALIGWMPLPPVDEVKE